MIRPMSTSPVETHGIGAGTVLRRKADGAVECITDEVTIEEPLEIRINQEPVAVTMRTPGNDEELAAGFLLSEAIIRDRADLRGTSHSPISNSVGNVLEVTLATGHKFSTTAAHRFGTISTSCGLCGKSSIESIRQQFPAIDPARRVQIKTPTLLELPERLRTSPKQFRAHRRYTRRSHF